MVYIDCEENVYRFLEIEFKEKYPSAKLLRNLFQIFSKNFVLLII
jgi:hypothetical protein